ncbi:MAG: glucose-1-phosphate adenylyltransferase family protein [Thermodesulfobacteriota bacterium]
MKPKTVALILAGGRVDELNVLTYYRPKSAVPFGGVARVIDFPLSNLMQSGIERVAILSQYRSYSLINHIGIGAAWDMVGRHRGISILPPFTGFGHSDWYRGSADAIYQNLDFIRYHDPETVLVLSGDHIYSMDYRPLIDYHQAKGADLTMACLEVPREQAHRFGVAEIDDEDGSLGGRVLRYLEKPARPRFAWASLTVYCFKPEVLYQQLEVNAREDDSYEFGRNVLPRMMFERRRVYGYKFRGYWGYARTIEEYWQANMDCLGASPRVELASWPFRTNLEHGGVRDCQPAKIGSHALVKDSVIANGSVVDGQVEHSVLFPGVRVGKGAVVRDSILFYNTVVEPGARLDKVITDVEVRIGAEVQVGEPVPPAEQEATVVGSGNLIPAGRRIGAGCTLYPNLAPEKLARDLGPGEVAR